MFFKLLYFFLLTCIRLGSSSSTGIFVEYHSQESIRAYVKSDKGANLNDTTVYSTKPYFFAPYNPGVLSATSLQAGLNMLNQVRYIAGIDNDVTLIDEFNDMSQAAALVVRLNGAFSSNPAQPASMDQALYDLAVEGSNASLMGGGLQSIGLTIVRGWMMEGSGPGLKNTGHRRWILNPTMEKTGFGIAYTIAVMQLRELNRPSSYFGIAWPAQNMPIEYFESDYPWSISMRFPVVKDTVGVKLTRLSDNRIWEFNKSSDPSVVGYFNVDNEDLGIRGCIIFRPKEISYNAGDAFNVSITGGGLSAPVLYTVNFFTLSEEGNGGDNKEDKCAAAVVHRVSFAFTLLLSVVGLLLFL